MDMNPDSKAYKSLKMQLFEAAGTDITLDQSGRQYTCADTNISLLLNVAKFKMYALTPNSESNYFVLYHASQLTVLILSAYFLSASTTNAVERFLVAWSTGSLKIDNEDEIERFMKNNLSWRAAVTNVEYKFQQSQEEQHGDYDKRKKKHVEGNDFAVVKKALTSSWKTLSSKYKILKSYPHVAITRLKVTMPYLVSGRLIDILVQSHCFDSCSLMSQKYGCWDDDSNRNIPNLSMKGKTEGLKLFLDKIPRAYLGHDIGPNEVMFACPIPDYQ